MTRNGLSSDARLVRLQLRRGRQPGNPLLLKRARLRSLGGRDYRLFGPDFSSVCPCSISEKNQNDDGVNYGSGEIRPDHHEKVEGAKDGDGVNKVVELFPVPPAQSPRHRLGGGHSQGKQEDEGDHPH